MLFSVYVGGGTYPRQGVYVLLKRKCPLVRTHGGAAHEESTLHTLSRRESKVYLLDLLLLRLLSLEGPPEIFPVGMPPLRSGRRINTKNMKQCITASWACSAANRESYAASCMSCTVGGTAGSTSTLRMLLPQNAGKRCAGRPRRDCGCGARCRS